MARSPKEVVEQWQQQRDADEAVGKAVGDTCQTADGGDAEVTWAG